MREVMKKLVSWMAILLPCLFFVGCEDEVEKEYNRVIVEPDPVINVHLETLGRAEVHATGVRLIGFVTTDNADKTTLTCGFLLSTNGTINEKSNPTEYATKGTCGEPFQFDIHGLKPSTTYYYCPYTKIGETLYYGDTQSFKTRPINVSGKLIKKNAWSGTFEGAVNLDTFDIAGNDNLFLGILYGAEEPLDWDHRTAFVPSEVENYASFPVSIKRLTPATDYLWRPCVYIGDSCYYGDVNEIFTDEASGDGQGEGRENGHAWVDLGLSVKWATSNIGASEFRGLGDYFAWGETQAKECFGLDKYLFFDSEQECMNKYGVNGMLQDGKTELEAEDDAASFSWKGNWRMPSKEDVEELLSECKWTKATENGVNGYTVTSTINGKSIFLPLAGCYMDGTEKSYEGQLGYYWTRDLSETETGDEGAFNLELNSGRCVLEVGDRSMGQSIRAVLP